MKIILTVQLRILDMTDDQILDSLIEDCKKLSKHVEEKTKKVKTVKEQSINTNWHELLRPGIKPETVEAIEKKARYLFQKWNGIERAAFCYKLAERKYLVSVEWKTIKSFGERKYDKKITSSINSEEKKLDVINKSKALKNIFGG
jgi:hypothetical protein